VINDEAHHAYRIPSKADQEAGDSGEDEEDAEEEEISRKEATDWTRSRSNAASISASI
jgi:hypothetical protein